MAEINQETCAQFDRIIKNVTTSIKVSAKNAKNFNDMKKFIFESTLTQADKQKLEKLKRPTLEFNILEAHISRLSGEFSIINPQFKVQTTNPNVVNAQTVDIVTSIIRKILYDSQSENIDNEVYKDQLGGGYSVIDVYTEYTSSRSFDQDIKVGRPDDPTLCGFDPIAKMPHKGDGRYVFKIFPLEEEDFKRKYPNVDIDNVAGGKGATPIAWRWTDKEGNHYVMICEYYEFENKRIKLHLMGENEIFGLKENQVLTDLELKELKASIPLAAPVLPPEPKQSEWREDISVMRYRFIGNCFIENKLKTDFSFLPIVFVDGNSYKVEGVQTTRSYVQQAIGAQRAKNIVGNMYIGEIQDIRRTRMTIAQEALPDKQEFLDAYINPQENFAALVYKGFNTAAGTPNTPPMVMPSAPIPPELAATFNGMDATVQGVLGSYNAQQGVLPSNISENTLVAGIGQSNAASKPYAINYKAAMNQVIRIILDLIPKIYITPRTMPIVDASGNRTYKFINDPNKPETNLRYEPNCLDLYVTVGVSFEAQKKEALKMISMLSGTNPGLNQLVSGKGLPILLANLDVKDSDKLQVMAEEEIKAAEEKAKQGPPPPPPEVMMQMEAMKMKGQEIELNHQQKMAQIAADKEKTDNQRMSDSMDYQLKYAELLMKREQIEADLLISQDANERAAIDQRMRQNSQALDHMKILIDANMKMIQHHGKIAAQKPSQLEV